jgi:hypothetical protein
MYGYRAVERFFTELQDRIAIREAGIVNQSVDASELCKNLRHDLSRPGLIGDIRLEVHCLGRVLDWLSCRRGGIPVQVHGDNVKTVLSPDVFGSMLMCQTLGDSPTDSGPGAGDDCNPVVRLTHGGRMLREGCWVVKFPGTAVPHPVRVRILSDILCHGQSRAREHADPLPNTSSSEETLTLTCTARRLVDGSDRDRNCSQEEPHLYVMRLCCRW